MDAPSHTPAGQRCPEPARYVAAAEWARLSARIVGIMTASAVILLTLIAVVGIPGASGVARPSQANSDHIALDIMKVKPGGPPENYAGYAPSTVLSAPANSLITITIRNFDLDATPLPDGSPYARVQGTVGGVAYADGAAYTSLALTNVAHTFTVPELGLNVPIPGHSATGKRFVTVDFQLHIGKAGMYGWRCFAPCGDGSDGQAGPMADERYMRGTLIVTK